MQRSKTERENRRRCRPHEVTCRSPDLAHVASCLQGVASRRPIAHRRGNSGIVVAPALHHSPMRTYVPRSIRQLRRLLKGMPIGMLTTQTSGGVTHSRTMMVHEIDEAGWLWFLTDRHSRKAWELIHNPQATIAFQSRKGDRYVSVQGTAVVIRDDVKLQRLWKPTFRA